MERMLVFLVLTVFKVNVTNAVVQGNSAPSLETRFLDYVQIDQQIPVDSVVHRILAVDPENGTLTYSISGVTYYKNDTVAPIVASDARWALTKPPASNSSSLCSTAESYSFPRNLFCMEPRENAVKVTSQYNKITKTDFSLFSLAIFVADNGVPMKNLSFNVYFRVKENCSDPTLAYSNLVQKCPDAREIIKRDSSLAEVGFIFTVPNNTKIGKIAIDFQKFLAFKVIGEKIQYRFSYYNGTVNQNKDVVRRLLINTTLESKLALFLWHPIDIIANKANVTLQLIVNSEKGNRLQSARGGSGIVLHLLDRSKDYCANDDCVGLYGVLSKDMSEHGSAPECARQDDFVVITKYSSCKAVNRPPVWSNSKSNYVMISRTSPSNTTVFAIQASDSLPQKLLYSIVGVSYYANETATKVRAFDKSWAVTSSSTTNDISKCKIAEGLPSPRNVFCIEHKENTIKTTGFFRKLNPGYDALFVVEVLIIDDGTPQLNTSGKIYVRMKNECPPFNGSKSQCQSNVDKISYFIMNDPSSFMVDIKRNFFLHKISMDFNGFEEISYMADTRYAGPVNMILTIIHINSNETAFRRTQYLLQNTRIEQKLLIILPHGIFISNKIVVKVELETIYTKTPSRFALRTLNSDISPITLWGTLNNSFCYEEDCRKLYNSLKESYRSRNQPGCLEKENIYLLDAKYKACGLVFVKVSRNRSEIPGNIANGTVLGALRAVSNNGVFYSIPSIGVFTDDVNEPTTVSDPSWIVKSKSDADRACILSEDYPYPRNLFCVNSNGFILATSKFANRLKVRPVFLIQLLASDSGNPRENITKQIALYADYGTKACAASSDLINTYETCDSSLNQVYFPANVTVYEYLMTVPSSSLLTQIGLTLQLIKNSSLGQKISFVISRSGYKDVKFTRRLVPPHFLELVAFNFSLYDRPIELARGDRMTVKIQPEFQLNEDSRGKNVQIYTVPLKDYCLSPCFENYRKIVQKYSEWRPKFPCVRKDEKFFSGKYGYCTSNVPPSLTISNIVMEKPAAAGSIIGKLVGRDKENTPMTYGIEWIHSALLKQNVTIRNQTYHGQSCTEAEKAVAPLNYICIVKSTGEIKATSKFVQSYGESLTIKAFVVDSGKPRRYDVKVFNVQIKDPCQRTRREYQKLANNCIGSVRHQIISRGISLTLEFPSSSYYEDIVLLEVDTRLLTFPPGTLYTNFTVQQVTKVEGSNYTYGASVEVTLNNTIPTASSLVRLPVHLSLINVVRVTVKATAFMKRISGQTNTSSTGGQRAKRLIEEDQLSSVNLMPSQRMNLNSEGLKLYARRLETSCASLLCVKTYENWLQEAKRTGLEVCKADPAYTRLYFHACLNPPVFKSHPKNISLKFGSPISLSCGYRNYTNVTVQWLKDGQVFQPPLQLQGFAETTGETAQLPPVDKYTKSLVFSGTNPELQGYFSCRVTDGLNHVVESKPSLVHFNDISTSNMKLKLRMRFNDALKSPNTDEYSKLSSSVQKALHDMFDRKRMHPGRKIVINGFRPGSVIVDSTVYFMNVTLKKRRDLCSQLKDMSPTGTSSNVEITSIETVSYDCCYASQTGEEAIKGVISWRTIVANTFDTQTCPYPFQFWQYNMSVYNKAHRSCLPNFRGGAEWQSPNISECAYKTLTTYKLENISKTNITDDNVESISNELNTLTATKKDITNRLDVKFTADTIENLVKSRKKLAKIANNIVNSTSNMMDFNRTYVAKSQLEFRSSSRILKSLSDLANEVPVSSNTSVRAVTKNVALTVKPAPQIGKGVIIKAVRKRKSGYNEIEMDEKAKSGKHTVASKTAEILLPAAMLQKARLLNLGRKTRVYSFLFENDQLFLSKDSQDDGLANNKTERKMNSRILSASIGNIILQNLSYDEELTSHFRELSNEPGTTKCVFWDTIFDDGFGAWSGNGCRHDGVENSMEKCRCNHLTNFAILLDVTGKGTPPEAAVALSIITYIGCAISLVCLLITFLTFAVFKNLRAKRPPRILMCLCFALIVTLIVFLAGITATDLKGCQTVAFLLHYLILVSFAWMAVEGFNLYLSFVKIVATSISHFILKSCLLAWGIPLVIVTISSAATMMDAYAKKNGDEWVCMVTGTAFYVGYLTPILLIVLGNLIVTAFVVKSLRASTRMSKDKKMDGIAMARIVAACSVLMGTTWIVGLFAVDVLTIPIQVIFCILNSLQGFFIFIFYCLRNKDARNEWKRVLGIRSKDETRSSSAGAYQRGKIPLSKKSNDSHKGLMISTGHCDVAMREMRASTLTTSLQESTVDDKATTLTKATTITSPRNDGQMHELSSSESMEMHFGLEPVNVEILIRPQIGESGSLSQDDCTADNASQEHRDDHDLTNFGADLE